MTDLELIRKDFAMLSGITEDEAAAYDALIKKEAEYISAVLCSGEDENDSRIVYLCAAKALYESALINQSECVSSFSAGDVSYSVDPTSIAERAKALYDSAMSECAALIKSGTFAFKAV